MERQILCLHILLNRLNFLALINKYDIIFRLIFRYLLFSVVILPIN
jgi:hypothetical protein